MLLCPDARDSSRVRCAYAGSVAGLHLHEHSAVSDLLSVSVNQLVAVLYSWHPRTGWFSPRSLTTRDPGLGPLVREVLVAAVVEDVLIAVCTLRANAVRGKPDMIGLKINLITTDGTAIHTD